MVEGGGTEGETEAALKTGEAVEKSNIPKHTG